MNLREATIQIALDSFERLCYTERVYHQSDLESFEHLFVIFKHYKWDYKIKDLLNALNDVKVVFEEDKPFKNKLQKKIEKHLKKVNQSVAI